MRNTAPFASLRAVALRMLQVVCVRLTRLRSSVCA
jgi:hypothetical protein